MGLFVKREPSDRLKLRNLAQWQVLADKALDAGQPCILCHGPMNPGRATLAAIEEGKPLEPYANARGYYAPVKPDLCMTCLDMVNALSHRAYWVNLESADRLKRRQMGLDGPQAA